MTATAPAPAPASDRVPDWVAAGTPPRLRADLEELVGAEQVRHRAIDLVKYASDASPYRLIPKVVVQPRDAEDVRRVLRYARRTGTPVTFRAGGTSLNGQGQGDGILVDVRANFGRIRVQDDARSVRVQPGALLGTINAHLIRRGRRLGPDPASAAFATIGGVIANNSGGMRCGTTEDPYSTVRALRLVLASGTELDTGAPDAEERFAREEPELARGLEQLRDEIRADAQLVERIRKKFSIKNTTGYRLCAFLDADTPVQILRRLLVGSEGTLGFIAEAELATVAVPRCVSTALLIFEDVDAAAQAVPSLVATGATAVELMVSVTLKAATFAFPGTPQSWAQLPDTSAALLVEVGADDEQALAEREAAALAALEDRPLVEPAAFTRDRETAELWWTVREGMFGFVGTMRPQGTSLIAEDVCVPPARVAEAAKDLMALLARHGFLAGVAGHASAGNLHFTLTPTFTEPESLQRYEAFMEELVELICGEYDGSLKAEHGTGRNMAPYVEREWGAKATELMWRVKALCDPDGILGPGVVLNRDRSVHLRDLKTQPEIEAEATKCIECGFCEPVCPSRDLTTTPRQRIVVRREMARQPEGSPVARALEEQFDYEGVQTCAADGTCRLACPVAINTGELVKGLRQAAHSPRAEAAGLRVAERFGTVERLARASLAAPPAAGRAVSGAARRLVSHEVVPAWPEEMPKPAPARLPATSRGGAAAVYFPACVNRIFGAPRVGDAIAGDGTVAEALVAVSARAGRPVWIPDDVRGHCCAMPWQSKGFARGAEHMQQRVAEAIARWTDGGRLALVVDATSCTQALTDHAPDGVEVLDATTWAQRLLPHLEVTRRVRSAALHPTCGARHLRLAAGQEQLARALADEVVVPAVATCCGMAGDRGLLHPELIEAATLAEADEVCSRSFDAHVSANRTCELALQQTTGRPYVSLVQLLEHATRPH